MTGLVRAINAVLAASLLSFALWGYGRLPDRIPIHFDMSGVPDGWGPRAMFIVLPMIGFAVVVSMMLVTRFAIRRPHLVNIPDKKRFLELSETQQQWVLEPFTLMMDLTNTLILVMFLIIQWSMYEGAFGRYMGDSMTVYLFVVIGCMIALPLWLMVRVQRRVREAPTYPGPEQSH